MGTSDNAAQARIEAGNSRWICSHSLEYPGGHFHCLVHRLATAKAVAAIEANRRVVLGRDFQKGPSQAGADEAVESLEEQGGAQALAAVLRHHAQVLDGTQT